MSLPASLYLDIVRRALDEDLAEAGDLTTEACIPDDSRSVAEIVVRRPGVVAGLEVGVSVFCTVDPDVAVELSAADGERVEAGQVVGRVEGRSRSILTAERTALNLMGRMSGVATTTADLVDAVAGTGAVITDTRKTMPGLRALDKYAVRMGGGRNHRFGLHDAVLIKDNHIVAAGSITDAVVAARARVGHMVKIEVEVETLEQLDELLTVGADVVLLDNMDPDTLGQAVEKVSGRLVTEASGTVTLETVRAIAESGVDVISTGWITHSPPQLDIGLDFVG
ncbi:MAG TPA: carboxylating nicotinate-nucleotide diphosphorylase [Acidimicrobiia bacterium]|nr:carboxylating nicotinate-nucleotide diphosphorylase [Acidimicrobiia bacterium]